MYGNLIIIGTFNPPSRQYKQFCQKDFSVYKKGQNIINTLILYLLNNLKYCFIELFLYILLLFTISPYLAKSFSST